MKKKILIIRFSSIGDIVLTSPVVRCIKTQLKDCEVHYLTKKTYAGILQNNPHIDRVWTFDGKIDELIKDLKAEEFDHIIDLHNNLRSKIVKFRLGVKSNAFNKLNFRKWLLVNLKKNTLPPIHIVERYLQTAKSLGVKNDNKGLDYFIPTEDEVAMDVLPESHQHGYIAFAIGAQHATKRLTPSKIIEICKGIAQPILLLGGKEDSSTGDFTESVVGSSVFNACGKFNLNQSASIVRQANKVITHDTGLMHIAAAFNKKIISIWGNTVPEFGMYPYLVDHSHIIEVKGLSCRPCSKIGYQQCPKGHFKCMNDINLNTIINNATI